MDKMYTAMGEQVFPVPNANSSSGMTYKDSNGMVHEFVTSSVLSTGLIDSNWKTYEEPTNDLSDLVESHNER